MIYTQQMTEETSVFLTEKRFILSKWRKFDFLLLLQFHGKNEVSIQVSQIQREQWLINYNTNCNSILASLFFCWFPLNEMMDQLRESKTGPHSNHWVCLFWVFACQHENFSLYGDVNSTAEELQIFWILMF